MKRVKKLPILCIAALLLLLALCVFGLSACDEADEEKVYTDPQYKFDISRYDVVYDIHKDCNISVTETLTIDYKGWSSTGFIRDIPVNSGTQVRNVKVKKLAGASPSFYYDVYFENNSFVSVDIGDHSNKYNKSETYELKYDYIITNSVVKKSLLPLNVIGHGWDCTIENVNVKLLLPSGFDSAKCYIGEKGTSFEFSDFSVSENENGRTVLAAHIPMLGEFEGITFDLQFNKGAIKNYFDFTPFWFVIIAALLLGGAVLLKVFVFGKTYLTPVVNYEAPNKMDPLIMGKLIDNKVNSEDVSSMIYYWANKGYLKINLDDKDDPTLIRVIQTLPEGCSDYEQTLFYGLFESGEVVKSSDLTNSYYRKIQRATSQLNAKTKGLYSKGSSSLAIAFAVIAGLIAGLAPLLLAFLRISTKLVFIYGLIVIVPAILANLFTQALKMYKFKLKKAAYFGLWGAIGLFCVIVSCVYLAIPTAIIGMAAKFLLCFLCMAASVCAALFINRTKSYNEQLNDILGFKSYIELAEKDQLEMMLEDNPQFYYAVLPYAQVLGITDKWEEKFENITIEPPDWATGDIFTDVVHFHILNNLIRSSMRGMATKMVSRPSSSGKSGFHGGFGGGFSGGGFGGGGGRGR